MFKQTKKMCEHFLNIDVPGFCLIVYKDGKCFFVIWAVFRYLLARCRQ